MNSASIQTVVVAENASRGSGRDQSSPIRKLTQIYTSDGELLAERDLYSFTIEQIYSRLDKMEKDKIIFYGALELLHKYFSINDKGKFE